MLVEEGDEGSEGMLNSLLLETLKRLKNEMKTMREEAQRNKDDLLRELKEREVSWEREKKEQVERLMVLERKIEVMHRKYNENVMRMADNSSIGNRLQEMQQKIETNVAGGELSLKRKSIR